MRRSDNRWIVRVTEWLPSDGIKKAGQIEN